MKYVNMILIPILMMAVAILLFWGIMASTGFVQMLWVALMIIAVVGMIFWDIIIQKTLADKVIAAILIIVIGGALKAVSFFVLDWPWKLMGQPSSDMGFGAVLSRLWTAMFNWWTFGGLVLGSVVSAAIVIWFTKTRKI